MTDREEKKSTCRKGKRRKDATDALKDLLHAGSATGVEILIIETEYLHGPFVSKHRGKILEIVFYKFLDDKKSMSAKLPLETDVLLLAPKQTNRGLKMYQKPV